LLAATLAAALPEAPPAKAAPGLPVVVAQSAGTTPADVARDAAEVAREAAREAKEAAREITREATQAAREASRGARISIDDREYDSFDQFLDRDPALAFMILGIVFIVFLTPILIIALVIWYKVRKTRMQNEAMLSLAEKGVIPPAEAIGAIGSGRVGTALSAVDASAPVGEQVKRIRKEAAWSDLRKGVLLAGVGLALTLYGILDERSPGWLALVLLFVGVGYIVLWYFEDRQVSAAAERLDPAPGRGPGDRTS